MIHAQGLRQAMRYYHRLCADPESAAYNRRSATSLVYEGLQHSPQAYALMQVLQTVTSPVSTRDLGRALTAESAQNSVGTILLHLLDYALVQRQWTPNHQDGGGRWVYSLSEFGQVVMSHEGVTL